MSGKRIVDKAAEILGAAMEIKYAAERGDHQEVQHLAFKAKKLCQSVRAQARRLEVSNCAHVPADAGHKYFRGTMPDGSRKFRREFRCTKCGKAAVKVEEVLEEAEQV